MTELSQPLPEPSATGELRLHASTVAVDGRALVILGPSGCGKSTLALDLVTLGAELVADDQTLLRLDGEAVLASPYPNIAGRIEARYVGLLRLPYRASASVALAIDLGQTELHRLPPRRNLMLFGREIPLLHRPPGRHAANALYHCLLHRREAP